MLYKLFQKMKKREYLATHYVGPANNKTSRGKKHDKENYRPISIINVVQKLETILANQIQIKDNI